MATDIQLTFDAAEPATLAAFWGEVLGYEPEAPPPGHDTWESWLREMQVPEDQWGSVAILVDPEGVRPRIYIQRVPEAKVAKNRLHIDVRTRGNTRETPPELRRERIEAEAHRLVGLGATRGPSVEEHGGFHIVLQDPEGNEFCLT